MENNSLSYIDQIDKTSIKTHEKILNLYKENIADIISLKGDTPIFLDTNVLLKSYSISFEARESLYKFYNDYCKRIHLTGQVQLEFTKNREDIIERFFEDVTQVLPNSYNSEILNHFKAFLEKNKTILVDYKDFEKNLKNIESQLIIFGENLCSEIDKKKDENCDLLLNDKFLKIFSLCNCLSISDELIIKAKYDFDALRKNVVIEKLDSELKKLGKVFPGMGDLKLKPDYPYGDFIIYYELMKFALENNSDVIFLTYDTTKGDWMKFNKNPHTHYVENFYLNTGHILYILDAKRVFEESLNIKFTSLINVSPTNSENYKIEINIRNLEELLINKYPKAEITHKVSLSDLCDELIHNGYSNLEDVEFDADKANDAFLQYLVDYEKGRNKFNIVGNLRVRLELYNEAYCMWNSDLGEYKKSTRDLHKKYKHLIK